MAEANFNHDCDHCSFLGSHVENDQLLDLYFCQQDRCRDNWPTVVLRYGDEPGEYASGISFTGPAYMEAKRRAVEEGLITQTDLDRFVGDGR